MLGSKYIRRPMAVDRGNDTLISKDLFNAVRYSFEFITIALLLINYSLREKCGIIAGGTLGERYI